MSWMQAEAQLTLERLLPRLNTAGVDPLFEQRLAAHFPRFFAHYLSLYGNLYDCIYHIEQTLHSMLEMIRQRPADLQALDALREADPEWFTSERMLGGVAYVDRFAGTLAGLRERIPYFQELGLTYMHLMPLFAVPEPHNDGGYAISSFREVNPKLGTMQELVALSADMRAQGISLVLDFVFNHTADDHIWARRALNGEVRYQRFYRMFDDRTLPDQYERHLREIFPEFAPGAFTWRPEISKWVWTTFWPFQWDLNYANPEVFTAMFGEMLFLANQGVEVLRLDAVPFVWKEAGTACENLPQVHDLICAFNALMRIAAPALIFKSEAIVHPRDVRSYVSAQECPLSYNPIMMVALWEAAATRDVRFLTHTMQKQFGLIGGASWVNYLRSHDDIGWGFADEDAADLGINGFDHRYFLNMFYTGRYPGTFARGLPFNYNPRTQDMRINGTLASLAGLEQALESGDATLIEHAIRRIVLLFSVVFSAGGIPLIYLGDEIGTLNDYSYADRPETVSDSRWVHRPAASPESYARRTDATTPEGAIYSRLQRLIALRKSHPVFADEDTRFFDSGSRHVLAFTRHEQMLVLANFSDQPQAVALDELLVHDALARADHWQELVSEQPIARGALTLDPWSFVWLVPAL